jgi:uncharacterized protein (TIGR02246 family)
MRKFWWSNCCLAVAMLFAQTAIAEETANEGIQQVLHQQVEAWNRGDINAFMRGYKDAPDTTFIGKSIERGYAPILARYKKAYASKDAMGRLDFSDIEVRSLGPQYAVATGRFHLTRTTAGGGDATGIFSLLWEKTIEGWKIILDHTTSLTP